MRGALALTLGAVALLGVACKPVVPPPPATQTLTITASQPSDGGTTDGGPDWTWGQGAVVGAGLNCHTPPNLHWLDESETTCTVEIPTGQSVTLVTRPDDVTSYADWRGDCVGDAAVACTVKMDGPHTVGALFGLNGLALTVKCMPADPPCYGTATATVVDWSGNPLRTVTFGEMSFGGGGHYIIRLAPGTGVTITIAGIDPAYSRQVWDGACATVPVGSPCALVTPARGTVYAGYGAAIE